MMAIVVACLLIHVGDLPGWLYSVVGVVGLLQVGLSYYFTKQIVEDCLADFAKKAAAYNKAMKDE